MSHLSNYQNCINNNGNNNNNKNNNNNNNHISNKNYKDDNFNKFSSLKETIDKYSKFAKCSVITKHIRNWNSIWTFPHFFRSKRSPETCIKKIENKSKFKLQTCSSVMSTPVTDPYSPTNLDRTKVLTSTTSQIENTHIFQLEWNCHATAIISTNSMKILFVSFVRLSLRPVRFWKSCSGTNFLIHHNYSRIILYHRQVLQPLLLWGTRVMNINS